MVDITSKLPALIVNVLAMPKMALVFNLNVVPLTITVNKLAVPFKVEEPEKVNVPALALRLPLTFKDAEMPTLMLLVMLPVTVSEAKETVPAPEIVLVAPLKVTTPAAVKELLDVRLPVTSIELFAVMVPEAVKLAKIKPVPVIVLVVPLMVSVPPAACVNAPEPVVAKLPATVMVVVAAALIPEAVRLRLLKLYIPVPLIIASAPVNEIVLVAPVRVPVLIRLPCKVWEKEDALKVAPVPILTEPVTIILLPAVKVKLVAVPTVLIKLPTMESELAGIVFTNVPVVPPVKVRLP